MWKLNTAIDDVLDTLTRIKEDGYYGNYKVSKAEIIKMSQNEDSFIFRFMLHIDPEYSEGNHISPFRKLITFDRKYSREKVPIPEFLNDYQD